MLRLKNIRMTNEYIEADYTPEDSVKHGFARLYLKTGEIEHKMVNGYETTYPSMAIQGLKGILERLNSDHKFELPKEKTVMWY